MKALERWSGRRTKWALLSVVLASVASCAMMDSIRPPVTAEAPLECAFPTGTELAFAGRASAFELGLGLEDETEQTMMYVTAEPVDRGQLNPPIRLACSLAGWGIAMFEVPADWTPPPNVDSVGE